MLNNKIFKYKIIKKYLALIILTCVFSILEMPNNSSYYNSILSVFLD